MRTRTIRLIVAALCVSICTVLGCADDSGEDDPAAGSDADTASQSTDDSGPRRDAAGVDTSASSVRSDDVDLRT